MAEVPLLSTRQVADILALEEARLRYWAQTGIVGPSIRRGGRQFYTFSDVVGVKATKDLCSRGLPLQRVRRAVEALRQAIPASAPAMPLALPVARLRVLSDGDRVVVADEGAVYEPLTGQLVLDFALGQVSAAIAKVLPLSTGTTEPGATLHDGAAPSPSEAAHSGATGNGKGNGVPSSPAPSTASSATSSSTVLSLFLQGVTSHKQGDVSTAEACYLKALALDPELAAAHTNLGNLYFGRGALDQARRAYECALAIDDGQPEARFNLANLLAARESPVAATTEYLELLSRHPGYKDGHYNLAVLLESQGDEAAARHHYGRYLELETAPDRFTAQAKEALWRLGSLS